MIGTLDTSKVAGISLGDWNLIEKAKKRDNQDWDKIDPMEAESIEARELLQNIRSRKFHNDEFDNDSL